MNDYQFDALFSLHNDKWVEGLLSAEFLPVHRCLSKRERVILDLKVQLYCEGWVEVQSNKEVARLLKLRVPTVVRALYDIRYKFRNEIGRRVDNQLHPEIYRRKARKARLRNESFRTNN